MDFTKYRRLKKAVLTSPTIERFLYKVAGSTWWFGIPLWNKEHYKWFYERIKGGARYGDIQDAIR